MTALGWKRKVREGGGGNNREDFTDRHRGNGNGEYIRAKEHRLRRNPVELVEHG